MINDRFQEVIFVGLPGPTHNYGGLSADNVASSSHRGQASRPKEAAMQVLGLIRLMRGLGIPVGILPPQLRPSLDLLRTKCSGEPAELIMQAAKEQPALLEQACSSSAMWVANAATVTPMPDATDSKLHITVANLHTNLHRRIEAKETLRALKSIFALVPHCEVNPRLSALDGFLDEGAANQLRLSPAHGAPGLNVFVYGTDGRPGDPATARQNLVASEAISAKHQIPARQAVFIKQNPEAIAAGVFHNDVVSVSNGSLLLAHEKAFGHADDVAKIEQAYEKLTGSTLHTVIVREAEFSVAEAVATYFFNSQIISTANGMAIIAPQEVRSLFGGKAEKIFRDIIAKNNPVASLHIADLRQSMHNGGGPACLRLRVVMDEEQLAALKTSVNVLADDALLENIGKIIEAHYPEALHPKDLADPALYRRSLAVQEALSELMKIKLV